MTTQPIRGLHHVTAIAGDPQRNLDFYTQVLGLRFVKKTVNFDDPGTYHFYFGDDTGAPGTILTFFPWPHATRGAIGAGEVSHTAFRIPAESVDFWQQRLAAHNLPVATQQRFGATVLSFADPDGMNLELVAEAAATGVNAPRLADVPPEHALCGFAGVTLLERDLRATAAALNLVGFRQTAEETGEGHRRVRFEVAGDAPGRRVDVIIDPAAPRGRMGRGTVHHIAFRAHDDADQKAWLAVIAAHLGVSPIMDRDYFHSIYFREPGGVLFELATDNPGFAIDEPLESLGETLRVPAWLESHLPQIERRLPPVTLHKAAEEVRA